MAEATSIRARTRDEAIVYLDLRRCPQCGARERHVALDRVHAAGADPHLYAGECDGCGRFREIVIDIPRRPPTRPPGVRRHLGDDEPSRLLDPGQWLLSHEGLAEQARAALARGDRDAAHGLAELAVSCVDEVIKFVPPGEPAVPEPAFWTPDGRRALDADASRFTRQRLVHLRDALREEFDPLFALGATYPASACPVRPHPA